MSAMDDPYATLRRTQAQVHEKVQALNQRLNAVSRPTHPSEFSEAFRDLERSVAELEKAANAFFHRD